MKKLFCLLSVLLLALASCGQAAPEANGTETKPVTTKAVTAAQTAEALTEAQTLPENVREEEGVLIYEAEDYTIKYPKGFTASYADGMLKLAPSEGAARYVTVEKTEIVFSDALSSDETVNAVVSSLSGTIESEPEKTELGGVRCVKFRFISGGIYVTSYILDHEGKTYVMCAASEDDNDDLPARIAQTIKFNTKESSGQ